jgi:hypothetical protein
MRGYETNLVIVHRAQTVGLVIDQAWDGGKKRVFS